MDKTENTSKDADQSQRELKKQKEVKPRKRLSEAEKLAMDEGVQRIFLEFVGKEKESFSSTNCCEKISNECLKRQQQRQTPPSKKKKARNEVDRLRGDEGVQRMLQEVYAEVSESREEMKEQSKRISDKAELSIIHESASASSEAEVFNRKSKKKVESLKSKHIDEEEHKGEVEKRPNSGQIRVKGNIESASTTSSPKRNALHSTASNAFEKTEQSMLVESSSPIAPVSVGDTPKIHEDTEMVATTTSSAKRNDAHESREKAPLPKLLTVSSSTVSFRSGINSKVANEREAKIVGAKPIGQAIKQPMYVPSEEARSSIDEDLLQEVYGDMEIKESLLKHPMEEKGKNMDRSYLFSDTLKRKRDNTNQEDSHLKHQSNERQKTLHESQHLKGEVARNPETRKQDIAERNLLTHNKFNNSSQKEASSHHRIYSSSDHCLTHNARLEPGGDKRQESHKKGQLVGSTYASHEHSARFSDNSMANHIRPANPSNLRFGGNHRTHHIDFPSSAPSFNDVIQSHKSVEARRFHNDIQRNEGEAVGSQDQSKHLRQAVPQAHNSSFSPLPDRTWYSLQNKIEKRPSVGEQRREDFTTSPNMPVDRPLKSILKRPSYDAEVEKHKRSEHSSYNINEMEVRPQSFPNSLPSAQNISTVHDSVFKHPSVLDLTALREDDRPHTMKSTSLTLNVPSSHDSGKSVVNSDSSQTGSSKEDDSSQTSADGEQEILIPNMVPRAPGIKELQGEFKTTYEQDARTLTVGAWMHVTDEERRKHFERYGTIEDVRTIRYVTMIRYSTIKEMKNAVLIHNQNKVVGRFGGVTTFLTTPPMCP